MWLIRTGRGRVFYNYGIIILSMHYVFEGFAGMHNRGSAAVRKILQKNIASV